MRGGRRGTDDNRIIANDGDDLEVAAVRGLGNNVGEIHGGGEGEDEGAFK